MEDNRLKKLSEYNLETEFIIKKAYLEGALDGRLFSYLKTWEKIRILLKIFFPKQ